MGYLTRCVLSWEINRRCEDYLSRRRLLALNAPRFVQNSRLEFATTGGRESADPWRADRVSRRDRITCPRSRLEARLLFCPVSFEGDPAARPPCLRQTLDRRQSADRISV